MILHCIVCPYYTFLWPENGPQWPKHVDSLIKQIQRQLCFDVPTPFLIFTKDNGDDASKDYLFSWSKLVILSFDILYSELVVTSFKPPSPPRKKEKEIFFNKIGQEEINAADSQRQSCLLTPLHKQFLLECVCWKKTCHEMGRAL